MGLTSLGGNNTALQIEFSIAQEWEEKLQVLFLQLLGLEEKFQMQGIGHPLSSQANLRNIHAIAGAGTAIPVSTKN